MPELWTLWSTRQLLEIVVVLTVAVVPGLVASTKKSGEPDYGYAIAQNCGRAALVIYLIGGRRAWVCFGLLPEGDELAGLFVLGVWCEIILLCGFIGLERWFGRGDTSRRCVVPAQDRGWFFVAAMVAAIAEEIVFRGYFLLGIPQSIGQVVFFAVLSGILFVLVHKQYFHAPVKVAQIVSFTALQTGLALGTGSLWAPIGSHLTLNLLACWRILRQDVNQQTLCEDPNCGVGEGRQG